ncbi:MAG TPA: DinB family protein [Vicinamibacterales bacterium]|nr:DinB family protein [Vicinamibacterales bacterium]
MPIVDSLLPEYDHEFATTRKLLERVPEAELGWKPHEKSMTLGQLAGHLANLPFWCAKTMQAASYDVQAGDRQATLEAPASRDALLKSFDEQTRVARDLLARASDAELTAPWTLQNGGQEIFTMPRLAVFRSFVMNHMIHHRGQLTVYLRLKDVPLPAVYGPTADEQ